MIINVPPGKPYTTGTKVLDGHHYRFTFRWNITTKKWYMDIVGLSNSVAIKGVALLGGKDLLANHGYSELGELHMIDGLEQNEDAGFAEMGYRFNLEYTPL